MIKKRKELYDGVNNERTENRLEKIERIGMEEVSYGEFGFRNITSGLYIEKIWHMLDKDFEDYIKHCLKLKIIYNKFED